MDIKSLAEKLHSLERQILPHLKDNITLLELISLTGLKEVEVMRALQWLENKKALTLKRQIKEIIKLDKNGEIYLKKGLPEKVFLQSLDKELTLNKIEEKTKLEKDEIHVAIGLLKRKNAINLEKRGQETFISITNQGKELLKKSSLEEQLLLKLPIEASQLTQEEKYAYQELKKRSRIVKTLVTTDRLITLTDLGKQLTQYKLPVKQVIDSLTPEIIKSEIWTKRNFRHYDVEINVPKIYPGKRHFVNQSIEHIKRIWLDLGFKEMQGKLLDISFWNFDALFTPQDHPARDLQDTFFIKNYKGELPDQYLVRAIKDTHENGGKTGSKGWQYKWDENKARELVLRTHTTILSAKTISCLKQSDLPAKFFSVGKVFRNETLDWKHSFEFYQVEGIVVDENVNFKHLLGYLKQYYEKLGFKKIKFRPSFFPYTSLSCEIIVYDPKKKQWLELGGAGIFRPEVVKPLLGKDIPVLAWGQGLERSIMDYYNIKDLRIIYGNDLKLIKETKIWK